MSFIQPIYVNLIRANKVYVTLTYTLLALITPDAKGLCHLEWR